ncbi:hypothetical protein IJT93_10185 [bacterium]|nr:hypothetical protein [bacterium]
MDEVFNLEVLQRIKRNAIKRLRRNSGGDNLDIEPTEQDYRDILAREIFKAGNLNDEIRRQAFLNLVQVSPGGILAMAWLCEEASDIITVDKIKSFASEISDSNTVLNLTRAVSKEGLDEAQCIFCADALLSRDELSRDERIDIIICLLISNCLSEEGRNAILAHTLEMRCFTAAERRILYQWAIGMDVKSYVACGFLKTMPYPPSFLARIAIVSLVRIGDDALKIVNHILNYIDSWIDTRSILHGLLDLIEMRSRDSREREFRAGSDPNILFRQRVFELCVASESASLRRRAYTIAAKTEGRDFLRQALKDKDLEVRIWALNYIKGLK